MLYLGMVDEGGQEDILCVPSDHKPRPSALPSNESIERASRLFRALGDNARLRLLTRLIDGERCVGELAKLEGEALSTISQRLRVLRTENLIVRRRTGKHINYAVADRHIMRLVTNALEHAAEPAHVDTDEELKQIESEGKLSQS